MIVRRHALSFAAAALFAVGALAACSTGPESYQGISLGSDTADDSLRALARQAAAGDKPAQLALGIRFETGDGVPVDLDRAERLYRRAAATTGDERGVYFSGMRPKSQGKVLPSWFQPPRYGLPAAQARLDALRQRRAASLPR